MLSSMKDRIYSLAAPWFFDGSVSVLMTVVPLLALRYGASPILLGTIGLAAQAARMPVALTSGRISEHIGRKTLIVPAAILVALAALGLCASRTNVHVMIVYVMAFIGVGMFYPPLQALIGEVSRANQLSKNLGAFNVGWCVGAAMMAIIAGWLVKISLFAGAYVSAAMAVVAGAIVLSWRSKRGQDTAQAGDTPTSTASVAEVVDPKLLLISRIGTFAGWFGMAVIRTLFPKVGLSIGWSESEVALVVALVVVGLGAGMLGCGASPWWRGKVWPQLVAQLFLVIAGVTTALSSSPVLLGGAFCLAGVALSVTYTSALYLGLSSGKALGKNSGIHESIGAGGFITGCLFGGIAAQDISLRAPYAILAALGAICLVLTAVAYTRRPQGVPA